MDSKTVHHQMGNSIRFEDKAVADLRLRLPALLGDVDVRKNHDYFKQGKDFIWDTGLAIDLKAEKQNGVNCAAEMVSADRSRLTPGWLLTSQADWIVHYFPLTGDLVCVPMAGYRTGVKAYMQNHDWRVTSTSNGLLVCNYLSWCLLFPVEQACRVPGAFWLNIGPMPGVLPKGSRLLAGRAPNQIEPADLVQRLKQVDAKTDRPPIDLKRLATWLTSKAYTRNIKHSAHSQFYATSLNITATEPQIGADSLVPV